MPDFICPIPSTWNEIYKDLCSNYELITGKKLPNTVLEIRNAGGPPTPLILNGWVFSNDSDKRERWQETLEWAEKYNLLYLTNVNDANRYLGNS